MYQKTFQVEIVKSKVEIVLESKHREINHFLTNLYAYFYTLTLRYPHWYLLAWHPAKYMHLRICILTHLTIWITLEKSLLKTNTEFLRIIKRKKCLKQGFQDELCLLFGWPRANFESRPKTPGIIWVWSQLVWWQWSKIDSPITRAGIWVPIGPNRFRIFKSFWYWNFQIPSI